MSEQAERERTEFWTDFPFVRSVMDDSRAERFNSAFAKDGKLPNAQPKAAKGDALLSGYANTWVMDRDFEFIGRRAFDNTLPEYLRKNPIILLQHDHAHPLGQMMDGRTDDTGLLVDGYIRQPQDRDPDWKHGAYNDVLAGILRTMSIGGFFYREIVDNEILVSEIDLFEISVVAVPSNPDSIFEATMKAAKGLGLHSPAGDSKLVEMMQQLLGMVPVTDPALAGMPELAQRAKYHELAAHFTKRFEKPAPDFHDWRNVAVRLDRDGADVKTIAEEAERVVAAFQPKGVAVDKSGILVPRDVKAGRVLSKANEGKLEKAQAAIQEVLDAVRKEDADENAATGAAVKGLFGEAYNGYELQDRLWDGFWALQCAIRDALDAGEDLAPVVNEFRDWLVATIDELSGTDAYREFVDGDLKIVATLLGERDTKAKTDADKDSERHCPECGTYMDNAVGAACPNCGHVPKAASADIPTLTISLEA